MTDKQAARARPPHLYSFLIKLAGAALLVILADRLFYMHRAGSTLGLFAGLLLILTICLRLDTLRSWPSRAALLAAALSALALALDPSLLALALYATALTIAALMPRTSRFDDGWRWTQRLILHAPLALFGPFRDWRILRKAKRRQGPTRRSRLLITLVLPLAGSAIFLTLFAQANPVIANALANFDLWFDFNALTWCGCCSGPPPSSRPGACFARPGSGSEPPAPAAIPISPCPGSALPR
jgi:hypothetical protein